jgi:hypothetical protein
VQQQSRQPPPSLGGEAMEGVAEPEQVILEEYWQVFENSVKYVMERATFVRLFVSESKAFSKNKPIKWGVINEKALPVTKAHFDSKVEGRNSTAPLSRSCRLKTLQLVYWRTLTMILAMMRTKYKLHEYIRL